MRVTMLNKYYPPHLGGIEFHMRDLAEGLVANQDASVRAIVCADGPNRVDETINGVEIVRLGRSFEAASMPFAPGFARAIGDEGRRTTPPDVLHFHFPYPWGELSWLRANPGIPTVVTYHSDIVRQKLGLAAYGPALNRFLDGMDLIIASSPNMVEHSEYLAPRADKCRVINFGIDVERYAPTPQTIVRATMLAEPHRGRKLVLFVGRLVYYKGADVLVRAMADVPDADLVMIGKGPLEAELRETAVARGIQDRVHFIAHASDDDLAAWYHAADVFVLPSVARSEAFGLVQIEAHAAGTPVVSTNLTTGVPYANLDGETGLIVPVGDDRALAGAIQRILADDSLRVRLGTQAKERAWRDFTIPRMCEEVAAAYEEAAEIHQRRKRRA